MKETLIQLQIYYEIAMSIGNSLDLKNMLKESLATYLRKLDCSAGVVLMREEDPEGASSFNPLFSIPRNVDRNSTYQSALKKVPHPLPQSHWPLFKNKLPITGTDDPKTFFYIMDLPDFGLLILVKRSIPFELSVIKSLIPLNEKMARSCIACLQKETVERVVEQLKKENYERKRAEEEKRQLESRILQFQKMEAIGTLAGGIAHDFNNLLMGIQGRTSLMLMGTTPTDSHFEHLKGIEEYVESSAQLTKQLLGFARGGKYEVKPADLNEIITKSSEMFGRTKKEVTIHRKYQPNIWVAEVDAAQIEQVLLNLYVNAWQAMEGSGELYLQTENVRLNENDVKPYDIEPGKFIKMSVTDTGIGMDEDILQKIFDPFFTTKEISRGAGLGLASAYGIIKNHNGFINVYSEKGKGATFNIYLPASKKKVEKDTKTPVETIAGKETVLLVDDEEIIINVGQQILKKLGYKVLAARDGHEAIEVYKKNNGRINLVILDMVMPDMGGEETYQVLKNIDPGIKVLVSSGYSIEGQAQLLLEQGCNGFIQKPFKMNQLSQKIREILDCKT